MNILDTVIGQARSTLSRSYLTAGGVPAVVVVIGWRLYSSGSASVRSDIVAVFGDTKTLAGGTIFYALAVASLAGLFFAGRSLILRMFQAVPGRSLGWLRRHLLERQATRWRELYNAMSQAEQRYTVLRSAAAGEFTRQGVTLVTDEGARLTALQLSESARASVKGDQNVDAIVEGLEALYTLDTDPRCEGERQAWKRLGNTSGPQQALTRLRDRLFIAMREATEAAQQLPDDERWIAPTRLGNLVAALDDYAVRRYKIATSTLWTRLWGVLDEKDKKEVTDAQLGVEVLANATAALAILIAAIIVSEAVEIRRLLTRGNPMELDLRALGFLAAYTWLATASYSAALFAFQGVAERIVRLVDLHRLRVITGVGYKPPATVGDEIRAFVELDAFFSNAESRPDTRALAPPKAPRKAPTKAPTRSPRAGSKG